MSDSVRRADSSSRTSPRRETAPSRARRPAQATREATNRAGGSKASAASRDQVTLSPEARQADGGPQTQSLVRGLSGNFGERSRDQVPTSHHQGHGPHGHDHGPPGGPPRPNPFGVPYPGGPSRDAGPPWRDQVDDQGRPYRSRGITDEKGRPWTEVISGDNRWKTRDNAREEAIARGPEHLLELPGPGGRPLQIRVHGASPEELDRIRRMLEALPPELRGLLGDR